MFVGSENRNAELCLTTLIVILGGLISKGLGAEEWTQKVNMPTARYGLSTSVFNGKIYAIGGRAGNQFFATVEEYDPATDSWTRKADMPTARVGLATGVVNGKIYAIGGNRGGGLGPTRIVEEYDPVADRWTRKADMPTERSAPAVVANGRLYVIGGTPRGVAWGASIVEEYDPTTDTWTRKADMPSARGGLALASVNGKIYAIGGTGPRPGVDDFGPAGAMILSTVEEYDPATDTWTRKADMPTARRGLSAIAVKGIIYAIGGNSEYGQDINIKFEDALLSTIEAYDPTTDTWTKLPDMPTPRTSLSASAVDSMIYAIGGQPGSWPTVTEAVEVYSTGPWEFAANPSPANGAMYLDTWATLTWNPGDFAVSHNVYLGTSFDDVNERTGNVFQGSQAEAYYVIGLPGFPYPDGLIPGTTYYWRIDEVNEAHPDSPWKGPVWSFTVPSKKAYGPFPPDGAESVELNVVLSWAPGLDVILHTVYFSDNVDDVVNATGGLPQSNATYTPGTLELGKSYYWRVDESTAGRGSETYKGDVWSFVTERPGGSAGTPDSIVIDGFEHYDVGDNQIWFTWHDGLGYGIPGTVPYKAGNGTGSEVGDPSTSSYTEQTIVHSGAHSMPFYYDNDKEGFAKYSEVEMTLVDNRNWTGDGDEELSLWFRGYPVFVGSFTEGPAGTYTMSGSGADIAGSSDEFHYAYKTLSGAGSIIARVDSIENTHNWAKAGIMIRETLDPGSKYAFASITPAYGITSQSRVDVDARNIGTTQGGIAAPHWLKLERDVGGGFTVSHSSDGSTWRFVENDFPVNIRMSTDVYIGLALTSHHPVYTCQAVFSDITITGDVGQQWTNEDVGILSNEPEPMYVAIANSTGTPAVVYHDDPSATLIDTWTQWTIPTHAFTAQGVELGDVDRFAIGLGTKGNAITSGGSGKMYFDNIRLYGLVPQPHVEILLEAETADTLGQRWRIYNDQASSGGKHIGSQNGDGNGNNRAPGAEWITAYNFDAPAGVYKIVLRAREAGSDSFWVRIIGATSQTHEDPDQHGTGWVRFNGLDAPDGWHWDEVHSADHGNAVVRWTLPGGTHTLEIGKREDGVLLDAIFITDKID